MKKFLSQLATGTFIAIVMSGAGILVVHAQEGEGTNPVDGLNAQIREKQEAVDELNKRIEGYQQKIEQAQSREASLSNQIDLLANRTAKTQLDIEETEAAIDLANTQIAQIENGIREAQKTFDQNRLFIQDVLLEMQAQDNRLPLLLLFGTDSFSELFDTLQQLENVSTQLKEAVERARATRETLLEQRSVQDAKKGQLLSLETSLERERATLQVETESKEALVQSTKNSEAEFKRLLRDVQEEQEDINYQVSLLQQQIEDRLKANDQAGDSSVLSWPFSPLIKGISTYFRDPTYPFRNLFEHSGIDLPAARGTPVSVAAPGYVAWTKTGRMYGNYVMVIHSSGIATLYAHLSRIDVVADQFVKRGDTIGAVGSTGFSTGPHLHFEVRLNGIPTDPMAYLPAF